MIATSGNLQAEIEIIVAGRVLLNPATRNEALALARWMAKETQQEPGCISYHFSLSLDNDCEVLIFEAWASAAALAAHFQTETMRQFNQQLPQYLASRPIITRYQVSNASSL
jgi:quinol monooxygenase YgiN